MQKALYRAYRPQTFDEVVGQDAIVTALKNQIMTGHVGHAYLFSGTRGTGKTSCAKIFARAVNCLDSKEGNPCNMCAHCRAILEETTMDVVEMDAASNRGIDDIRELRETVIYPPAQVRYKVYIIDEAHMITKEGFNALLKMMEEPPAHLIFILATTEPEKIPPTILSRVQRYEFKRIDLEVISKRLAFIAEKQGVTITPEALATLSRAADGALRDALSLLDQVMAMGEPSITEELVERVLGTAGKLSLAELTQDVLRDHMTAAMTKAESLLQEGKEAAVLLREWIAFFQQLLLIKGAGKEWKPSLSDTERCELEKITADVSMTRLLDSIDHLVDTEVLLQKSDHAETLFLAAVARLINYASPRVLESRIAALEEKLAVVERWQSPENAIRDALDRYTSSAVAGVQNALQKNFAPPVAHPSQPPTTTQPSTAAPKSATPPLTAASQPDAVSQNNAATQPSTASPQPTAPRSTAFPQSAAPPHTAALQPSTTPSPNTSRQPTAVANQTDAADSFLANPEAWYRRHERAWRSVVEKEKIVPAYFLGRFAKIDVNQGEVSVFYAPENEAKIAILKGKEEELSAAFSRFAGETIRLHFGGDAEIPRPLSGSGTAASTSNGMGKAAVSSSDSPSVTEEDDWTWQELQRTIPKEILKRME